MKVITSSVFDKWFQKISDIRVKVAIVRRLENIQTRGHFGDFKVIGGELKELRFFVGGGIRIYFVVRGDVVAVLLNGGDKSTQSRDIAKAKEILKELENDNVSRV